MKIGQICIMYNRTVFDFIIKTGVYTETLIIYNRTVFDFIIKIGVYTETLIFMQIQPIPA